MSVKPGGFADDPPHFTDKCTKGFCTSFLCNPVQNTVTEAKRSRFTRQTFWRFAEGIPELPNGRTRRTLNPRGPQEERAAVPVNSLTGLLAKLQRSSLTGSNPFRGAPGGAGRGRRAPGGPQGDKNSCHPGTGPPMGCNALTRRPDGMQCTRRPVPVHQEGQAALSQPGRGRRGRNRQEGQNGEKVS